MQLFEILSLLFGSTTVVSIYVAWTSRKAQVLITESNALQEMQKAYRDFVSDQRAEVEELKAEIQKLRQELNEYKSKCKHCKTV